MKMMLYTRHIEFLADRTAARSMIGYWYDTVVCLSVCLSVMKCFVAFRVGVRS